MMIVVQRIHHYKRKENLYLLMTSSLKINEYFPYDDDNYSTRVRIIIKWNFWYKCILQA